MYVSKHREETNFSVLKKFGPMKAAGVSFYDTAASLSILVKPPYSKISDLPEVDDWDIEFAKDQTGVSG